MDFSIFRYFYLLLNLFPSTSRILPYSKFHPQSAAITFANAFMYSRLDYYNSLFYDMPKYCINRLQKIQMSVARIFTRTFALYPALHIILQFSSLYNVDRINFKLL